MPGFVKKMLSVFGLVLAFLMLCLMTFTQRTCPASDCLSLRTPQQVVLAQRVDPIGQHFARPVVLQQLVSHPPRQQIVQPVVVRQQVIRQQVAPAAPRVEVIRRGIFGIPRTAVRVN